MATIEWKSFDVMSVGKLMAALGVLMGLIIGLLITAMVLMLGNAATGIGMGIWSVILFPIGMGLGGFIDGVIMAFIYNIVAGKVGGIKINS